MTGGGLDVFLKLSAALTGFDEAALLGTGQARLYYEWVLRAQPAALEALLEEASRGLSHEQIVAILVSPAVGSLAKQINYLWYTAQWRAPFDTGAETVIVSPAAYQEGLVWPAILAHPPGAKQQGFGSWGLPPSPEGSS